MKLSKPRLLDGERRLKIPPFPSDLDAYLVVVRDFNF
jgi:hypothetical protein